MNRYYRIWLLLTINAVQTSMSSRFNALILIVGKLLRFGMFFFFLTLIASRTQLIAGYTLQEIIFFYMTYQLIDTIPQMFMREVYRFRSYVIKGDFDYFLAKPFSPLFRALFGGPDILDVPILIISLIAIVYFAIHMTHFTPAALLLYFLLIGNAILIAIAFHVLVLAMGVVSTEVDNAIMLYRDVTQMGRIPVDIYQEPLRGIITFIIPVGIMMTIPAKAMLGLLTPINVFFTFLLSFTFFTLSMLAWKQAVKQYGSASS